MKKSNLVLVLAASCALAACSKVPAGNVGVKVNLLGSSKGVEVEELGVGRYWIGFNEELYLFPTFTQNYVWTKGRNEGSPVDESMSFQTVEGLSVSADVGISYSIQPKKVSAIFQKYRKGVDEITDIYLRNMVRDALVTEASTLEMATVYGKGKADLIKSVEENVKQQVEELGITIERVYWVGNLRLPATVVKSLNAKIEATQKAAQRRNEVEQAKAEADKKIEEARGIAESKLAIAKADAQAIKLQGEALRSNPSVLQWEAIKTWDGVLPKFTGSSAIPFINVGKEDE